METTLEHKQKLLSQHQQEQQEQQEQHKHYCRFCKKGFSCEQALSEHMRAHEINDEPVTDPNIGPPTAGVEWDSGAVKMMHVVSANPNRSCCICECCSKEFTSRELFLEHGNCSSVVAGGINDGDPEGLPSSSSPRSRHKGKRTRRGGRANYSSSPPSDHLLTEEEDLANILVIFSAARDPPLTVTNGEESFASTSKQVEDGIPPPPPPPPKPHVVAPTTPIPRRLFGCIFCKKVFTSHQALGGHRASHKRVKGCFAARVVTKSPAAENAPIEDENNNIALSVVPLAENSLQPLSKVHECSICNRQFTSGQALGGHKRCHWIASNSGASSSTPAAVATVAKLTTAASTKLQAVSGRSEENVIQPQTLIFPQMFNSLDHPLDLNMSTPMDDLTGIPVKLDIPDMNDEEERSTWLQLGI